MKIITAHVTRGPYAWEVRIEGDLILRDRTRDDAVARVSNWWKHGRGPEYGGGKLVITHGETEHGED